MKSKIDVDVTETESEEESDKGGYVLNGSSRLNYDDIALEILSNGNIIINDIKHEEVIVQTGRTGHKRTSEKKRLYTVVLNLNA